MLMGITNDDYQHRLFVLYACLILFGQIVVIVSGEERVIWTASEADHKSLQAIKRGLVDPTGALRSWTSNATANACSGEWAGIKCSKGQVIAIQLPWKALGGRISDEIGELRSLRRISLHGNFLSGEIPESLSLLPNLRGLYLFENRLSGEVPASLSRCRSLQSVDLSNNLLSGPIPPGLADPPRMIRLNLGFNRLSGSIPSFVNGSRRLQTLDLGSNRLSGEIPSSLGRLKNLSSLTLSENRLSGEIPESLENLPSLESLDLSRNNLSGQVPEKLSKKFNSTSFSGNVELCGYSAATACPSPPPVSQPPEPPSPARKSRRLSTKDILLIAAGALLLTLLALLCCLLLCCLLRRRRRSSAGGGGEKGGKAPAESPAAEIHSGGEAGGKLVHFDGPLAFTADDLLCATAEIMGKSGYGTCYKASLEDGHEVAVKRLREKSTKGHKEFEAEASALAKIRHPNILALRAYYLGPKGEKLLVYDYMPKGTLASFLHARGPETAINFMTRLNIAIGIARGLVYLHTEQNTSHGNITSGNVLLDDLAGPHIADAGLSRLASGPAAAATTAGSAGYSAPELSSAGKRASGGGPKADVYSFGVVVLELLTGKSPGEPTNGVELPQWVASIVKEEWTNEVFDLELMRDAPAIGDDLLNVLKLALHCVDPSPEARPDSAQVLAQLEEVKAQQQQQQSNPEEEE